MLLGLSIIIIGILLNQHLQTPQTLSQIDIKLADDDLSFDEIEEQVELILEQLKQKDELSPEQVDFKKDVAAISFGINSALLNEISDIRRGITSVDTFNFESRITDLYVLFRELGNQTLYFKYTNAPESKIERNREICRWIAQQFQENLNTPYFLSELQFRDSIRQKDLVLKLNLETVRKACYSKLSGEPKVALEMAIAGIEKARKLEDTRLELEFLTGLQYMLNEIYGMTNSTIALGRLLVRRSEEIGHDYNLARAHYYNGLALIDQGLFQQAMTAINKSGKTYRKLHSQMWLAHIHERLAVIHRNLGEFNLALQNYERMRELGAVEDRRYLILYEIGLGLIYLETGRFSHADSMFTQVLELTRQEGAQRQEVVTLINLGLLNLELGHYDRAIELLKQALPLAHSIPMPHSIVSIWSHLTELYVLTHNIKLAHSAADSALAQLENFEYGVVAGRTYLNVGKLQQEVGNYVTALRSFERGLRIFEKIELPRYQIEILNMIGETHRRAGRPDTAQATLARALELCDQYPELSKKWSTHFYLARLYRDQQERQKSERFLKLAINEVGELASQLRSDEQRANFSQKIQPVFEEMVALQFEFEEPHAALSYTEQERAHVLKLLLQDNAGRDAQETLEIRTLQSLLQDSSLVLEYEITEQELMIWAIGPDTFDAQVIAVGRSEIDSLVQRFRSCIDPETVGNDLKRSYDNALELGQQLYTYLLAPVAEHLNQAKQVHIIPDEKLHYLPFSAFHDGTGEFLIEKFVFHNQPSAAILQHLLASRQTQEITSFPRTLAVAASPELPFSMEEASQVAALTPQSRALLASVATEKNVRSASRAHYDAMLFASHGRLDEKKPYRSAILLATEPGQTRSDNDGQLMFSEITKMECDSAKVVYLSACESASGKLYRGEGMVGLQRAFMIAGANTVVANLWEVNDKTSKLLTVEFFKLWLTGISKGEALREAQRKLIKDIKKLAIYEYLPHPYFWAPVTITGGL